MTTLYFYKDDYIENPRDTEGSNKVVRLWYDERVRYADEDITDSQCMGIVAERLIVRRILGLEALDMTYLPKAAHAKPFGRESPILAELLMPGVFIAMALVPLSPTGPQGRPIMARLYCASGLQKRYNVALEGSEETALQGFSWFLTGVSGKDLKKGIGGRSWLLAANLLVRIVTNRDEKTARNLARHYIVTGDVSGDKICPVMTLRKPELSRQFDNFKWIIPKENEMDIPKRKVEKPESLKEAYQMIESMRSTATKSLFRFLREGNLAGVKEQYRIGADIFAREEKTDLTCLEVVAKMKAQLYAAKEVDNAFGRPAHIKYRMGPDSAKKEDAVVKVDPESFKKSIRDHVDRLDAVDQWLRLQGADSSMMFYLMAINGDETGIVKSCEYAPINTCDDHGHTAVDLALIGGEFEAAKLLRRHGGWPNPRLGANLKLTNAIGSFCDPVFDGAEDDYKLIAAALDAGFSPETLLEVWADSSDGPSSCTLFAIAVSHANYEVLEACLRNGADANKKLTWKHFEPMPWGKEAVVDKQGTPWSILSGRGDMKGERRERFRELLLRYGACIAEE